MGVSLAETTEYDKIFAALKHPIRRQILLLLEEQGEASFTDIQNAVDISDTGLVSYHLKELAPLIEQARRGKYHLSEIGQTSIVLFRKVERERDRASVVVRRELENVVGKIVFLFCIIGVTVMAPLTVDIYVSVQNLVANQTFDHLAVFFLVGLGGMIFGVILFVVYEWHYFSRNRRTSIIHSTMFSVGVSVLSILWTYMIYRFEQASLSFSPLPVRGGVTLLVSILRTLSFLVSAPLVTYLMSGLRKK